MPPTPELEEYDNPMGDADAGYDAGLSGDTGGNDAPDVSPSQHSNGPQHAKSKQENKGINKTQKHLSGIENKLGQKGGLAGELGKAAGGLNKFIDSNKPKHLKQDGSKAARKTTEKAVDKAAGKAAAAAVASTGVGAPIAKTVGTVVEKVGTKRLLIAVAVLICLPILSVMLTVMMLYQFIKNPIKAIWNGNPVVAAVKALIINDHAPTHKMAYEIEIKDFKDFHSSAAVAAPAAAAPKEGTLAWKYSQIDWEKSKFQTVDQTSDCRVTTKQVANVISGKQRAVIDKIYFQTQPDAELSAESKALCLSKVYPIFGTMMRSQFLRRGINKEIGLRYNYAEQDKDGNAPTFGASPSPTASPGASPTAARSNNSYWGSGLAYLKAMFMDKPLHDLKQTITAVAAPASTSPGADSKDPYEQLQEKLRNKTLDRIWLRDQGEANKASGASLAGVNVPPGLANFGEGSALMKQEMAWVASKTGVPTAMIASQAYQESSNYWEGEYNNDDFVRQHSYMIPGAGKEPMPKAKGDTGCTAGCQGPMQLDKFPGGGNYNDKLLNAFNQTFGVAYPEHGEMMYDTAYGYAATMAQSFAKTLGDPAATNQFYQNQSNRVAFLKWYGTGAAGDKHFDEFNQGATSMRLPGQSNSSVEANFAVLTPTAATPTAILSSITGSIGQGIGYGQGQSIFSGVGDAIAAQTTYYGLKKNYDAAKARADAPCATTNPDACVESGIHAQADYYKASKAVIDAYESRYADKFGVSDGATIAQYHDALYAMKQSFDNCSISTTCSTSAEYRNLVARAGAFAADLLNLEAARLGIGGSAGGGAGAGGGSSGAAAAKPPDDMTKPMQIPTACDKDFEKSQASLKSSSPIDYAVIKVANDLLCGTDPQDIHLDDDLAQKVRSAGQSGADQKFTADVLCRFSLYNIETSKSKPLDQLKLMQRQRVASMANAGWSHVTYADTQVTRPLMIQEMQADFYKMSNFASAATYHKTAYGTENGTAPQSETLAGAALAMDMLGVHPEYPIQKAVRQLAGNCSDYLGNNQTGKKDESGTKIKQINDFYPQLRDQMKDLPYYQSKEFLDSKEAVQKAVGEVGNSISSAVSSAVGGSQDVNGGVGLDDVLLAFAKVGTNVSDAGTEDGPQNFNRMHAGVQAYMYAYNLAMGGNLVSEDRAVADDIRNEAAARDQDRRAGLAYRLFDLQNPRSLASRLGAATVASPKDAAKNVASVFTDLFSPLRNLSSAGGSLSYYVSGENKSAMADNSFSYSFLKLEPTMIPDSVISSDPIANGKYIEGLKDSKDGDKKVHIDVWYVPGGDHKEVDPNKGTHTIKEWFGVWDGCFSKFVPGELALDDDALRECQPIFGVNADLDTSEGGKLALAYKTYHYNSLLADAMLYLSDPSKIDQSLYASSDRGGGGSAVGGGNGTLVDGDRASLNQRLVSNPHISFDGEVNKCDLTHPDVMMDPIVRLLVTILEKTNLDIRVSATKSDHNKYSNSGNISNHFYGEAIDIGNEEVGPQLLPWLYQNRQALGIDELIYANMPAGTHTLKHGQDFNYSSSVLADHHNHIHLSSEGPQSSSPFAADGGGQCH